jgi:hypothetical protein
MKEGMRLAEREVRPDRVLLGLTGADAKRCTKCKTFITRPLFPLSSPPNTGAAEKDKPRNAISLCLYGERLSIFACSLLNDLAPFISFRSCCISLHSHVPISSLVAFDIRVTPAVDYLALFEKGVITRPIDPFVTRLGRA